MVSCETQHAVNVLMKNGDWVSLHYPEIVKASNFGRTIFDKRGWLWATSSRIESGGLFCLNYNGTIAVSYTHLAPYILRSKVLLHGESTALVRSKCIPGMVQTNTFLLY